MNKMQTDNFNLDMPMIADFRLAKLIDKVDVENQLSTYKVHGRETLYYYRYAKEDIEKTYTGNYLSVFENRLNVYSLADVCKWLLIKYGIHVWYKPVRRKEGDIISVAYGYCIALHINESLSGWSESGAGSYPTPDMALKAGIRRVIIANLGIKED